jgi:formylmethanofuran dehydrogenase subunit E
MWYEISVRCTGCNEPIVIKKVCVSDNEEVGVIGVCLQCAERVKIAASLSELREQMQTTTLQ